MEKPLEISPQGIESPQATGFIGPVTTHLLSLLQKQVNEHGLVVWFDPEGHYLDLVKSLNLPGIRVAIYEGSFYALRYEIEPILEGVEPPHLLVYVPLAEENTANALIELTRLGAVLKPGQNPVELNTRLSVIAESALKDVLGEEELAEIKREIEKGQLFLSDLDNLALKGKEEASGLLALIFGTRDPERIALSLLSTNQYDEEIIKRGAWPDLIRTLSSSLGVTLPNSQQLDDLRHHLARYILVTEFLGGMQGELPTELAGVNRAKDPKAYRACLNLARAWRREGERYTDYASTIERELALNKLKFEVHQLRDNETFPCTEELLQRAVVETILTSGPDEVLDLAEKRKFSFWSMRTPSIQGRWALIATAAALISEANRVAVEIKEKERALEELLESYALGQRPWCQLDTHQRHLENLYHTLDFELSGEHDSLERLLSLARRRYSEVGDALVDVYLQQMNASNAANDGLVRQSQVFAQFVSPALKTGKTAYVLADALRFEMARELAETLRGDFQVDLKVALGTVPGLTEIGMAALLPGAETGLSLKAVAERKLGLEMQGILLRDRKDRVKWLKSQALLNAEGNQAKISETKLDDVLRPSKNARAAITEADLVFVTAQEIDELCESDNIALARRIMDDLLHQLSRLAHVLVKQGVQQIVITADHGYLFTEEIEDDRKVDPPGGQTVILHRRVWIGRGGSAGEFFFRAPLSKFGVNSDLEIAVPKGLAVFKVPGGARAYFHGGISPQEVAIPVLILKPKEITPTTATEIKWSIIRGSKKITTRLFSLQISGEGLTIFDIVPPKVRVEVRAKGQVISRPFAASYGFEDATGDIQLRVKKEDPKSLEPNTITMGLIQETTEKIASIHLLESATGRELARLENLEMNIAL